MVLYAGAGIKMNQKEKGTAENSFLPVMKTKHIAILDTETQ